METHNDQQSRRPTSPDRRAAFQALKALQNVGGLQWRVIFWVLVLLTLTSLFAGWLKDAISLLVGYGLSSFWDYCKEKPDTFVAIYLFLVTAVIFVAVVDALRRRAVKGIASREPHVDVKEPAPAIAVIMFLSTPLRINELNDDKTKKSDEEIKEERHFNEIFLKKFGDIIKFKSEISDDIIIENHNEREIQYILSKFDISHKFKKNLSWRINIQSLRPHLYPGCRLKEIIVIPSEIPEKDTGTSKYFNTFRDSIKNLFQRQWEIEFNNIEILSVRDIPGVLDDEKREGVNYFDVEQLICVIYKINSYLKQKYKAKETDIIIDITSGSTLCSAAGMAFATLVPGRRVQYVDTNTLKVLTYDVTHEFDIPD